MAAGARAEARWDTAAGGAAEFRRDTAVRGRAEFQPDMEVRVRMARCQGPGAVLPTYRPGVAWTDLRPCLPGYVTDTLVQALPLLDRKLHGLLEVLRTCDRLSEGAGKERT